MIREATATLKSMSPYSQSAPIVTPKKSGESPAAHEERVWRERMHVGENGHVVVSPMALKNMIAEAAKFTPRQGPGKGKSTWTKNFEAGILVVEPMQLPTLAKDVQAEHLFLPSDGRRGGGKRVWKLYPKIEAWTGKAQFVIADDHITEAIFETYLREAGSFIGLGRFRPRNNGFYGRFSVEKIEWKK